MLVTYLRCQKGNGEIVPWACVVATGPGKVGYSICHENDKFNKERGRKIAAGRAAYYHETNDGRRPMCTPDGVVDMLHKQGRIIITETGDYRREVDVLAEAMDDMLERSQRYWPEVVNG